VHQVCRKCGQFCPHFKKIVYTFRQIGTLFTYIVHVTAHVYCLPLLFKCGQFCPLFVQIVLTFCERVYCSHKTLFTYLTKSVDKIVHTFIKLSTLLSERVHCSRKTLFMYLTESVDKLVHTFIKLPTLSGDEFYCSRLKCSYGKLFT
jgi:hypothetical protein